MGKPMTPIPIHPIRTGEGSMQVEIGEKVIEEKYFVKRRIR
jgi:hypothetical protein